MFSMSRKYSIFEFSLNLTPINFQHIIPTIPTVTTNKQIKTSSSEYVGSLLEILNAANNTRS